MRHSQVDEAGLLAPGDDLDGAAERRLGAGEEVLGILGHPQGVGADGAYRLGWEPAEPLAEAREGLQGPLLRLLGEPLVGRQASGEPDRLAEGVERVDLVVHHAPDLQAERIRPEVDGG